MGIEPMTLGLKVPCSNLLSYRPVWCPRKDSNLDPPVMSRLHLPLCYEGLVGMEGFEPSRHSREILSLLRLPFRHIPKYRRSAHTGRRATRGLSPASAFSQERRVLTINMREKPLRISRGLFLKRPDRSKKPPTKNYLRF